jgi:hypothetical protein
MCTNLEYLAVHSFYDVLADYPHCEEQLRPRPEFEDWTPHEISIAFHGSHFLDSVKTAFLNKPEGRARMHDYCKIFERAAEFLPVNDTNEEKIRLDLFLTNISGCEHSPFHTPFFKFLDTSFISAKYDLINKSRLDYIREKLLRQHTIANGINGLQLP